MINGVTMKKQVLISGAGFAGLTLAHWLDRMGYQVTIVESGRRLRTGGSPIDIRGEALQVIREMGLYDQIKAKEFVHTDELVDVQDQTLVRFSLNAQPEYEGDFEIHRRDLLEILYKSVEDRVNWLFGNSVTALTQHDDRVDVAFRDGTRESFDFVFGADGTHSAIRRLTFGDEKQFKTFFGAYFAFVSADHIDTGRPRNTGVVFRAVDKQVLLYQFADAVYGIVIFRSPELDWDHHDREQQRQILRDRFGNDTDWKIPDILDALVSSEDLYFDEVAQIHLPTWSSGRVALVGDAAHAPSFFTGMGTSLAMIGAATLAKALQDNDDYRDAFAQYQDRHQPFAQSIQSRITQGMKYQLPANEAELQASIDRFRSIA